MVTNPLNLPRSIHGRPFGPGRARSFGWRPSLPDPRNAPYMIPPHLVIGQMPSRFDLRSQMPATYDQGRLGSCTAAAVGAVVQYDQLLLGEPAPMPSLLAQYYWTRQLDGTTAIDAGGTLHDAVRVAAKFGVAPEALWPYDLTRFDEAPPPAVVTAAQTSRVRRYYAVEQSVQALKACLFEGFPWVFGFSVFESFMADAVASGAVAGVVPMPALDEELLGGHATVGVGWDDNWEIFIVRNSWGDDWGIQGHCLMPYDYVANPHLAADFWTIRRMT